MQHAMLFILSICQVIVLDLLLQFGIVGNGLSKILEVSKSELSGYGIYFWIGKNSDLDPNPYI